MADARTGAPDRSPPGAGGRAKHHRGRAELLAAATEGRGRIARYALGEDYHHVLLEKLEALAAEITATGELAKVYVDTGPVLEKPLAERAGVGWQGKSTMLIHPKLGPWLLLGEIITTLELEPDAPQRDHCGSCSKCIDGVSDRGDHRAVPARCATLHRLPHD